MRHFLALIISEYLKRVPVRRGKKRIARTFGALCEGIPINTVYGFPIYTNFKDATNMRCFTNRDDCVVEFLKSVPQGSTVIDIGANQGAMAILASRAVGESGIVAAFEPDPDLCEALRNNKELNKAENLKIFRYAIGPDEKYDQIGTPDPLHSGAAYIGGGEKSIRIAPIHRISEAEGLLQDPNIYVKIDTEGFELNVLLGLHTLLDQGCIKSLIIEIDNEYLSRFDSTATQLYKLLANYGYFPEKGIYSGHYDEIFNKIDTLKSTGSLRFKCET